MAALRYDAPMTIKLAHLSSILSLVLLTACATTAPGPASSTTAKPRPKSDVAVSAEMIVTAVSDGHSVTVREGSKAIRVHLAGIESPATYEGQGEQARRYLAHLVLGEPVQIKSGAPSGNPRVAQVFWRTRDLSLEQLNAGFARYDAASAALLSADERTRYQQAEAAARAAGYGIWKTASPAGANS